MRDSSDNGGVIHGRFGVVDVDWIIKFLGDDVVRVSGARDRKVERLTSLNRVAEGALIFCRHIDQRLENAIRSRASVALVPGSVQAEGAGEGPTLIAVDNPRLAFIKIMACLFEEPVVPGRHPTALIDETAQVAASASVGPFVVIGPRCSVGDGSALGAHVVLQRDVHVGANTRIDAGTIVGSEGFGFERNATGALENFPHLGGVHIGDNVDIGCNVCIDRGTLDDTVIGNGARIDNLTHISHNCQIGAHAVVVCQVSMCGSTKLGDYGWVSPSAAVLNQISVGERALVGLGAVVIRDVAPGAVVAGNPARVLAR